MADLSAEVVGPGGATWTLGMGVLEVREQSTTKAADDLVSQIGDTLWDRLGVSVRRAPGDQEWTVRTSDMVGVVRLEVGKEQVHIRISPKLNGLDLFFLADWAYGSRKSGRALQGERAHLDSLRTDPAACLLGWYLNELTRFGSRWLRRGYEAKEEDLVSRIRGRINMPRYMTRSIPQGRAHVIPCRFVEPSHDTPANRYLKFGLRRAAVLANAVPIVPAQKALREMARQALSLFANVTDVKVSASEARRLNLKGPLRHYQPLIELTRSLVSGAYVSADVGRHSQEAIMWSLNVLYEEALREVLANWPGAVLDPKRARAKVVLADGRTVGASPVKPDYVLLRGGTDRLVLDAKYKDTRLSSSAGEIVNLSVGRWQSIRIHRADVYQVVAYAQHAMWRPTATGLVYPVALEDEDPYPQPAVIEAFDPTVHIVFLDVGPGAQANLPSFYAALDSIPAALLGAS
jgi:5-methylcytosine-specific restriction enzyme subunit McrC